MCQKYTFFGGVLILNFPCYCTFLVSLKGLRRVQIKTAALQQDPGLDVTRGVQPLGTQRQPGSSTPKKEPVGVLNNDLWAITLSIID